MEYAGHNNLFVDMHVANCSNSIQCMLLFLDKDPYNQHHSHDTDTTAIKGIYCLFT